ncbi:CTP synthase [Fonticula alba]|uniref:CTP synthase n=1 Tax=Fonticula alba TaxID=691883 RepID=A0A058ZG14_FONAL|nr:CTP synthase [Fonticula alba]KCV73335.1 CTP synthase [Fonticula alba]|eukprot:XP_009493036.1 CTP synthase [Fonticula alba]
MVKYIVVSGGVISGIGKGIIASSTALLLRSLGLHVTVLKVDPYLNIDAGLMNPIEHGEVFVLDDGGEVDLDLGNYERFLGVTTTRNNNITTGKVYNQVIEKERRGDYLGKTVQVVPHITDEIQQWIQDVSKVAVDGSGVEPDVCVIELGGTVGDIESAPFVEAMRQFQFRVGRENICFMHVSLVPALGAENELKTKPTQASVRDLRGLGLMPDFIMCRSKIPIERSIKEKISMFCNVGVDQIISVPDSRSIYHVPLALRNEGLVTQLCLRLNLGPPPAESLLLDRWSRLNARFDRDMSSPAVRIALVGKYTELRDSYMSITKSLEHATLAVGGHRLEISWVESSDLEPETEIRQPLRYYEAWQLVCGSDGILVPGGFGERGIEGMIAAARWARLNRHPFLGICLGMQLAVVEFVRNVLKLEDAHSEEFRPEAKTPVIVHMPEVSKTKLGGGMRLGRRESKFVVSQEESIARRLYGNQESVFERHRHRYEVNPELVDQIEAAGMKFVAKCEQGKRMEILELSHVSVPATHLDAVIPPSDAFAARAAAAAEAATGAEGHSPAEASDAVAAAAAIPSKDGDSVPEVVLPHPFYVATQFHPEYLSRPLEPSPVFVGLILAATKKLASWVDGEVALGFDIDSPVLSPVN